MFLISLAKAFEDLHGLLHRGLLHGHRLETPLQCRVFLDVFPIFLDRGSADELDLAAGQGGLQDVGGIHGSLRSAGSDDRMELVDEEKNLLALLRLLDDTLDPLLKLSPVFASCHHTGHIESQKSPVL